MDSVDRHITRRRFLTLASAAAALAACGGSTPVPTATTQQQAATPPPTQQPVNLTSPVPSQVSAAASPGTSPTITAGATPAAAQGKPGGTKIYRTAEIDDIVFMDPAKITESTDYILGEAVYNYVSRYTYNPPLGTQINPELAQWEIKDDAQTYIFHLQKGVKFHGGNGELTADDIKWNWDRMKDPQSGSRYATDFKGSTITVLDPYTVQVVFDHPYPAFIPASLAFRPGMIMPSKAYQAAGQDNWKSHPIGSGPFMWDTWQPNSQVTLKRNPDYWGQKPKVDQIVLKVHADDRTSVLAVGKGELDAFYISDTDVALDVAKNTPPGTKFIKAQFGEGPNWCAFNMKKKPFDDINVRQAMRYALDIEAIAKNLFGGLADPIASFLPPFMFGYSAEVPQFKYDPDKARTMLKAATLPPNWNPVLLAIAEGTTGRKIAEAVVSYWGDVGIKVKVDLPDRGTFEKRRAAGEYDIFYISTGRIDPDQIATPYWHTGSTPNNSFYTGADDLIDRAKAEPDPTKRADLYRQLQVKISQDSPAAFLIATSSHLILNNRVSGVAGAGWQDRHDWFNVDVPAE